MKDHIFLEFIAFYHTYSLTENFFHQDLYKTHFVEVIKETKNNKYVFFRPTYFQRTLIKNRSICNFYLHTFSTRHLFLKLQEMHFTFLSMISHYLKKTINVPFRHCMLSEHFDRVTNEGVLKRL